MTEAPRPPEALARFSLYGRVLISAENIEGWYQILSGGDVSAASSCMHVLERCRLPRDKLHNT